MNLFGDITSITQSGPGKNGVGTVSQTEYRAYDARHHLCKIVRNDVGTTAFNNTVLGEVNWSAEGVSGGTVTNCTATVSTAQKVVNLYDNLGDIWKVTYADTSPDRTYTRDNNGNVLTLTAGGVSTTYLYNALDLVEKETMVVDGQSFVLDYHYATSGALSGITYPNGHRVNFAPNGFGEPTEAKRQAASGVNSFTYADNATYHANGMLASFTYGNGLNYALTLNNRRLPETFTDSRTGLVAASQTYHYDDNQNFIKILDNVNSAYSLTSLAYDGLDRLTSTTGGSGIGSSTMSYDGLGNITKLNTKNRTLDYTYNTTTNRLSSVNSGLSEQKDYTSFTYDSRGNITHNSHRGFSYNRANQMYASGTYQYVYDGHNRRVKAVDSDGTSYSMYGYDGTLRYIKSPTQTVNYIQLGAKLIAKDGVTQSSNSSTQHARPFGSSIEGENEDAGYTGHKFDTDLGLSYMQARYYDPVIGRFYSNDPVGTVEHFNQGNIQGFNRYAYANNNPYKYTDPDGATPVHVAIGIGYGLYRGYKLYKAYKQLQRLRKVAQATAAISENANQDSDDTSSGWVYDPESDSMVPPEGVSEGQENQEQEPGGSGGDDNNDNDNNKNKKEYNKKNFHNKNKRNSNRNKHQRGESRVKRDQGGEKKDERMKY